MKLGEIDRAWATATRRAGLAGLRFYDLRHVATTRMVETGMADARVMKITGHTQHRTFLRYVNENAETAKEAARLLDERRERSEAAAKRGRLKKVAG